MKKVAVVLFAVLTLITTSVFAKGSSKNSFYPKGSKAFSISAGLSPWEFSLFPGLSFNLGEFSLTKKMSLDYNLEFKGMLGFYHLYAGLGVSSSYMEFGAGAYFVFHFGLKNFDADFINKLDFYWGPGLKFSTDNSGYSTYSALGFSTMGGTQFFLNKKVSLFLEYTYFTWSYGNFGIRFQF